MRTQGVCVCCGQSCGHDEEPSSPAERIDADIRKFGFIDKPAKAISSARPGARPGETGAVGAGDSRKTPSASPAGNPAAEQPSGALSREAFLAEFCGDDPHECTHRLAKHDAAMRADNARLREELAEKRRMEISVSNMRTESGLEIKAWRGAEKGELLFAHRCPPDNRPPGIGDGDIAALFDERDRLRREAEELRAKWRLAERDYDEAMTRTRQLEEALAFVLRHTDKDLCMCPAVDHGGHCGMCQARVLLASDQQRKEGVE